MSGTLGPAAARRATARPVTFVVMPVTAVATQLIGLACVAQAVTSFPPIDTVMSPTCPRWAVRNASAAASWVVVGYSTDPAVCGNTSGHPIEDTREEVVAPPQPKFTSFRPVAFATTAV